MLKSLTATQKIWLSFTCLLLGYIALLIITFSHAFSDETKFKHINDYILPMKKYCQNAEQAYFQQLLFYHKTMSQQDLNILDEARKMAIKVEKALLQLQKINIDPELQETLQKTVKHYELFTANAHHKFKQSITQSDMLHPDSGEKDLFSLNYETNRKVIQDCFDILSNQLDSHVNNTMRNLQVQSTLFKSMSLLTAILFIFASYSMMKKSIKKGFLFRLFDIQNFLKKSIDGKQAIDCQMPTKNNDEITQTVHIINAYITKIAEIFQEARKGEQELCMSLKVFQKNSQELVSEIEEINNTSNETLSKSTQLTHFINEMAKASEQVSTNIINISSTTDDVAGNMTETNEFIDKMTASVNYIARSTEEGMNISEEIMEMAAKANTTINSLGEAAREIGKVTGVIKRIAVQTNLLALNASIEASTAGEAGKGFAVVANKIKQFASQSAKSAEDIASRIEGVQSKTENAIEVINNISDTIDMVSVTIGFIADAVDQQNSSAEKINKSVHNSDAGTNHIAKTISESTDSVESMSKYTLKSTQGAQEITEFIQSLNERTQKTKRFSRQLDMRVQELNRFVEKIFQN